MPIVLLTFFQVLLFAPLRNDGISPAMESFVGMTFVVVNALIILSWTMTFKLKSGVFIFLLIGLLAREFFLFADVFQWFQVPHSGNDTEAFASISEGNFRLGSYYDRLTGYTDFLTSLYFIVGPIRIIAQQLNVAFGMGTVLVCMKIFKELNFSERQEKIGVAFLALFPHLLAFSAILLRESPIEFCLACSSLFFIRWMKSGGILMLSLSILFVAGAAFFHGGCVFWLCGYVAALAIWRPRRQRNALSVATLGGVILAAAMVVALFPLMDQRVDAMATALGEGEVAVDGEHNADAAGSSYLTWLTISNPYLLLLFSPLKMFYFLFSPIPLDWRNGMDVFTFCFDSTFYIFAFGKVVFSLKKIVKAEQKNVVRYLMICILAMTFVFGYGTIAAGTAIRHRCKFFPELLVCMAVCCGRAKLQERENMFPPSIKKREISK